MTGDDDALDESAAGRRARRVNLTAELELTRGSREMTIGVSERDAHSLFPDNACQKASMSIAAARLVL